MEVSETNNSIIEESNALSTSFLGLKAYEEDQADFFFGREKEIRTLTGMIKTSTLTLLFGKSGTGKTSLLNAGVFPLLREDYLVPFNIKLAFLPNSPDIITQIKTVLTREIKRYGFNVKSYPDNKTLWEYFHEEPTWEMVTPVLVFDQFEELFTLASNRSLVSKKEVDDFIEELSDLIENFVPQKLKDTYLHNQRIIEQPHSQQRVKIIFSFREDYLPEFESLAEKIPSIKNSRFRLMPMNGLQALEVINRTWGDDIKQSEANKIVQYLTNDPGEGKTGQLTNVAPNVEDKVIEPSLLSQVCLYIEQQRQKENSPVISAGFLKKYPKAVILRALYDDVLKEAATTLPASKTGEPVKQNALQLFVEENLVTSDGRRTPYIFSKIEPLLVPGIGLMVARYYLREDGQTVELTHDVIVALAKNDREERRKVAAMARVKRRSKIFAFIAFLLIALIAGGLLVPAFIKKQALEKQHKELDNIILTESLNLKDKQREIKNIDSQVNNLTIKYPFLSKLTERTAGQDPVSRKAITDAFFDSLKGNLSKNIAVNDSSQTRIKKQIDDLKQQLNDLEKEKQRINNDLVVIDKKKQQLDNEVRLYSANPVLYLKQNYPTAAYPVVTPDTIYLKELNTRIRQLEAEAVKKQKEHDLKVVILEKKITELQLELAGKKAPAPASYNNAKGKKIYGYGHDYAEDKVQKP